MPKPIEGGGKGKGKSGKGYKGIGGKGMQVDGDAAYIGQHDYDYYDCNYFQQFAGDPGMVANFNPNVPETSGVPEFEKPKEVFKQHIEISLEIHEAIWYKLVLTSNKFGVQETK